jgi:hypothetical protein
LDQDDPRVALQRLSSEVHDELGFKCHQQKGIFDYEDLLSTLNGRNG